MGIVTSLTYLKLYWGRNRISRRRIGDTQHRFWSNPFLCDWSWTWCHFTTSLIAHLPVAIYICLGMIIIRPITVNLVLRLSVAEPEERHLCPCGVQKKPFQWPWWLLFQSFWRELSVENCQISQCIFSFSPDVVFSTVLFSMIVKSFAIPKIHSQSLPTRNTVSTNQEVWIMLKRMVTDR